MRACVYKLVLLSMILAHSSGCGRSDRFETRRSKGGGTEAAGGETPSPLGGSCGLEAGRSVDFAEHLAPLFAQGKCLGCHNGSSPDVLDLAGLIAAPADRANLSNWKSVVARLKAGTMPPAGYPKFDDCGLTLLNRWLVDTYPELNPNAPKPDLAASNPFVCKSSELSANVGSSKLNRLTARELAATLKDLFAFDPQIAAEANDIIVNLPRETAAFQSMTGDSISPALLDGTKIMAERVAGNITKSAARLTALLPCFTDAALRSACVDEQLIAGFGRKVFRGDLTVEERQRLKALYTLGAATTPQDGVRLVLAAMLQSSRFFYKPEINGASKKGSAVIALSAYELASRLSYTVWGSMPDDKLLSTAGDGSLLQSAVYSAEVDRLFLDPRARAHAVSFYGEWLKTENIPQPSTNALFLGNRDVSTLRADAIKELEAFVGYVTWDTKGHYSDLVRSSTSFMPSAALAELYEVPAPASADGQVEFAAGSRAGLMMKAALVMSSTIETGLIQRGVRVRRDILCDKLGSPDPTKLPQGSLTHPPVDVKLTSRQRYEQKTANETCQGCHAKINPLGFAMEDQDAIGRLRKTESVRDADGVKLGDLAIDVTVNPEIDAPDDPALSGSLQLGEVLAQSPKATACFARQWARFSLGRDESASDGCLLKDMYGTVASTAGSIKAMIRQIVDAESFKYRVIGD